MNITFDQQQSFDFRPWTPAMGRVFDSAFAFDTETTRIHEEENWRVPHYVLGAVFGGDLGYFIEKKHVAEFLELHSDVEIVFHNAEFDLAVLHKAVKDRLDIYDQVDADLVWDTQLLHRLLMLGEEGHTARGKGQSTLATCTAAYLGTELPKDEPDSAGDCIRTSYRKWLNKPASVIEPMYLEYLGKDVIATYLVYLHLRDRLDALLEGADNAFNYVSQEHLEEQIDRWGPQTHHTQLKASIVLRKITGNGLQVDTSLVDDLKQRLETRRKELLLQLREHNYIPGEGSQKALQSIMARMEKTDPDLHLPRTEKGKISTTADDLAEIRGRDPFVDLYLRYKETDKLLTSFVDKLNRGVVHPKFQVLVNSGRTSSYGDLNAQNLPRDKEVRSCLIPSAGKIFIDADYSTLELATLAQTVQTLQRRPSEMARLINEGHDLHQVFAAKITGKEECDVTKEERRKCKAFNFGKPGGMGPKGLTKYAKCNYNAAFTEEEAVALSKTWLELFPEMEEYLESKDGKLAAEFLGLTAADFEDETGIELFSRGGAEDSQPNLYLGLMALRVLGESLPVTRSSGRTYSTAEIDYLWGKWQSAVDDLPDTVRSDILSRKTSVKLKKKVRHFVTSAPVLTTTGRVRANAGYCQQRNTPFQGLASDGAKLALWRLWRTGYRIVNFIHDEVLVEVPLTDDLEARKQEVCEIMQAAMREVVPEVAIGVEAKICRRWVKKEDEKKAVSDANVAA